MAEHDETVEKVAGVIEHALQLGRYFTSLYNARDEDANAALRDAARAAIAAMGDGWPSISPELIDKLNKLATYLTEQGEYEACDLIDTVVDRLTPPPGAKP